MSAMFKKRLSCAVALLALAGFWFPGVFAAEQVSEGGSQPLEGAVTEEAQQEPNSGDVSIIIEPAAGRGGFTHTTQIRQTDTYYIRNNSTTAPLYCTISWRPNQQIIANGASITAYVWVVANGQEVSNGDLKGPDGGAISFWIPAHGQKAWQPDKYYLKNTESLAPWPSPWVLIVCKQ